MLYVCSCGFTAATATTFYKHLASSKESGAGHQLTQARFSDRSDKVSRKSPDASEPPQAAPGTASWVEEYLVIDQRDTTPHEPTAGSQLAHQASLPVSSAQPAVMAGRSPQKPAVNCELADLPLRDLQGSSRSWSTLGRQRSSTAGRPPLHPNQASMGPVAGSQALAPGLGSDDVELVEHIHDPRPSTSGAGQVAAAAAAAAAGSSGTGSAAQAALRMSNSMVNAMVVGLSPWRWFGSGSPSRMARAEVDAGPYGGLGAEPEPVGTATQDDGDGEAGTSTQCAAHPGLDPPPAPLEAVHAVRDVLIWRNPWHTSRVFGAGLYLVVCVRQVTKGHELLQPSTAVLALCFAALLRNVVREAAASYRRNQQQAVELQVDGADGECSSRRPALRDEDEERCKAAALLQQRLETMFQRVALGAARYGAALLVLGCGLLSGRRAVTSALGAALLWLGMVLGELRIISQPMFWLLCYVAAFTIPAAYYRCRHAMDAGVEAVLRFVVRVLVSGSRTALLSAAAVAALLVALLPLNFVLRSSLAMGAAFAVVLWQSEAGGQRRHGSSAALFASASAAGRGQGQLPGSGWGAPGGGRRHEHGE